MRSGCAFSTFKPFGSNTTFNERLSLSVQQFVDLAADNVRVRELLQFSICIIYNSNSVVVLEFIIKSQDKLSTYFVTRLSSLQYNPSLPRATYAWLSILRRKDLAGLQFTFNFCRTRIAAIGALFVLRTLVFVLPCEEIDGQS